jgi:hypothetical protein
MRRVKMTTHVDVPFSSADLLIAVRLCDRVGAPYGFHFGPGESRRRDRPDLRATRNRARSGNQADSTPRGTYGRLFARLIEKYLNP